MGSKKHDRIGAIREDLALGKQTSLTYGMAVADEQDIEEATARRQDVAARAVRLLDAVLERGEVWWAR
jgi:hypothetical protein